MAKLDTQISIRNILEKIIYIAVVMLFIFLWNINRKVNDISDNKASISKLWQKYGQMDARMDKMNHDIGTLKGRHIE